MRWHATTFKVAFFLLLGLAACRSAEAQKIRLLIAADTEDRRIGMSVSADMGYVMQAFAENVPEEQLQLEIVAQQRFSSDDLLAAIDRLGTKTGDALVVYYSGHGGYDQQGHYLRMANGEFLSRATLLKRMQATPARLCALLTDSCNRFVPRPPAAAAPEQAKPALGRPERIRPLFAALFFRHHGLLDVNAAAREQWALSSTQTLGGLFTLALAYVDPPNSRPGMGGRRRGEPPVATGVLLRHAESIKSWREIVDSVVAQTERLFKEEFPDGYSESIEDRDGNVQEISQQRQTPQVWSLPEPDEDLRTPPAAGVAIQPGDIIRSINGRSLRNTAEFREAVDASPPVMQFVLYRPWLLLHLETTLRTGTDVRLGVYVRNHGGKGVEVTKVVDSRDAPCANARLVRKEKRPVEMEPGDVILSVNGQPISRAQEFADAVAQSPKEMHFTMRDTRTGKTMRLVATLDDRSGRRFGVEVRGFGGEGVRLVDVTPGSPATTSVLDD